MLPPLPPGCFPPSKEHSRSTQSIAEQSSWGSQASRGRQAPVAAGSSRELQTELTVLGLVAALTPEQSPHLRPGGSTSTKTQPKLNSLSLLETSLFALVPSNRAVLWKETSAEMLVKILVGLWLLPGNQENKQSTPGSLRDSCPPAESVTRTDLPKQRQSQADIWHTIPAGHQFPMGNQLQSNSAHAVIIIKNLTVC